MPPYILWPRHFPHFHLVEESKNENQERVDHERQEKRTSSTKKQWSSFSKSAKRTNKSGTEGRFGCICVPRRCVLWESDRRMCWPYAIL